MRLLDLMIPHRGYWHLRYRYDSSPLLAVFAVNVDHIVAKKPPDNSRANLQAACTAWNIAKSSRRVGEFRERFSWWEGKPQCRNWDGLFGAFQKLYALARFDDGYLRRWYEAANRVREAMLDEGKWPYG